MDEQKLPDDLIQELDKLNQEIKKQKNVKIVSTGGKIEDDCIKKFFDMFLNQEFPSGAINKTLEKNFALYIVQNKIDLNIIQGAYDKNEWEIGGLYGYIDSVIKGKLTRFNIGEIINWTKNYAPNLTSMFDELKAHLDDEMIRQNDLMFQTKHLRLIDSFSKFFNVKGKKNIHILKAIWYNLTSCMIPNEHLIVYIKNCRTDLRDFLFIIRPTGRGKGNFVNGVSKILKTPLIDQKVSELLSYHEEQLIGKTINKGTPKNPDYDKVYGYFYDDYLILDECKALLTEGSKELARTYFLKALDKYGENLLKKKLTGHKEEQKIEYCPHFKGLFATQPFIYDEIHIILNGFCKRITPDYIRESDENTIDEENDYFSEIYDENEINQTYDMNEMNIIVKHLCKIKSCFTDSKNIYWSFEKGFFDRLNFFTNLLLDIGLYNSQKRRNYTKLLGKYVIRERLLKRACLLNLGNNYSTFVTLNHLNQAFTDLLETNIIELDFVNEKVKGKLSYQNLQGSYDINEIEIINWLHEQKAFSKSESITTLKHLYDKIKEVYTSINSDESARKKVYRLKERGLIKSKQVGTNSSRVWLNNPKVKPTLSGWQGGTNILLLYKRICQNCVIDLEDMYNIINNNTNSQENYRVVDKKTTLPHHPNISTQLENVQDRASQNPKNTTHPENSDNIQDYKLHDEMIKQKIKQKMVGDYE